MKKDTLNQLKEIAEWALDNIFLEDSEDLKEYIKNNHSTKLERLTEDQRIHLLNFIDSL